MKKTIAIYIIGGLIALSSFPLTRILREIYVYEYRLLIAASYILVIAITVVTALVWGPGSWDRGLLFPDELASKLNTTPEVILRLVELRRLEPDYGYREIIKDGQVYYRKI